MKSKNRDKTAHTTFSEKDIYDQFSFLKTLNVMMQNYNAACTARDIERTLIQQNSSLQDDDLHYLTTIKNGKIARQLLEDEKMKEYLKSISLSYELSEKKIDPNDTIALYIKVSHPIIKQRKKRIIIK